LITISFSRTGGVAQVVEYLPSKPEAPSTTPKNLFLNRHLLRNFAELQDHE
jgi:hypothetical protein